MIHRLIVGLLFAATIAFAYLAVISTEDSTQYRRYLAASLMTLGTAMSQATAMIYFAI